MAEHELTPELAKQLFGPRDLNVEPPEPPVEGLPPKDKHVGDYTDEEREAQHQHTLRVLKQREREEAERAKAEAERTDEQRFGDAIAESLHPDRKRAYNEALIRSIHGIEEP